LKYWVGRGKSPEPIRREMASMGALESVLGIDDRRPIAESDLPPWRMICSLSMQGPSGGGAIGTGWFVGPRTLITAGHCVYDQNFFGGWAVRIEVMPGRNGTATPFGTVVSNRFASVDRWINERDPDFDIGCVHLDQPLGETVGWFAIGALPADELRDSLINISGYPADRDFGRVQYFHKNRVLRVTERRIFYDVDTFGGQSGAPVWVQPEGSNEPLAVGIHAYGVGGTPANLGITANSAPRIIPEVFDQIQAWIAESTGA
jgi:V8-like Glu-specific endopeptidase